MKSLLSKFKLIIYTLKGGVDLATIYVTLIVKGYKTFAEVPEVLKEEVRNQLIALELGHLAE